MGDNISASNSTIINRSEVTNALNVVKNKHGKATMDFLTTVADHVEKSGRKGAGQLLDLFNEELARKEPREPVLKSTWEKIVELVPSLSTIANVAIEIAKLCGSGS